MLVRSIAIGAALSAWAFAAHAECAYENETEIRAITGSMPAWVAVTEAMKECGNVQAELNNEFLEKMQEGFAANPPLYNLGGLYGSATVPLMNANLIRPLDDLVEKYGQNLQPTQLYRVDGKIMAIAMMVNTQHLMYREDIFNELGIEVPETYVELLEAAEIIKQAGVVDYPFGAPWKTTWLAFVDMYLGYGGTFFDENWNPTINNEKGVAALEMMKRLSEYMDPEFLVSDSTYTAQQLQQKKIAMAHLWASRAHAMDDPNESQVIGLVQMASAMAPEAGMIPAASLWWDGIVIAANITDEEADAAFRVAMEGLDEEMVTANNDEAIWLIDGYIPTSSAAGAAATAAAGAVPYPASSAMSLMHEELGKGVADYLTGTKDAPTTLADIEAAYITAAQEAGVIQ